MFVLRNSIIAALCLSFPSVADALCVEMGECIPGVFPKKAKCFMDQGFGNRREFGVCCTEDHESPELAYAVCTSIFGTEEELADDLAEVIANSTSTGTGTGDVPVGPATCYESGRPGDRCWDPVNPVEASCVKSATYDTRTFGACCEKNAEALTVAQPDTVCTLWGSSAPTTVGAWTVTALGAVATTAAAFYGI